MRKKSTNNSDSVHIDNDLIARLLSVSRYVVADALIASAMHSMKYHIVHAQINVRRLLDDPKIRHDLRLTDILRKLNMEITEMEREFGNVFRNVPPSKAESSLTCGAHAEIGKTAEIWKGHVHQQKCNLRLKLEAHNCQVGIGPVQLQEIISILIVNSLEARSRNITIATKENKQWHVSDICTLNHGLEIVILDDGVGVAEEQSDILFEPTYTTKLGHGGYGLFIARTLARRAGGEVFYVGQSNNNHGAAFSIAMSILENRL